MDEPVLYDIRVRIAGTASAIFVDRMTAEQTHKVADNMCAAWGRPVPDCMCPAEVWVARLEAAGTFGFEDDSVAIAVERGARPK